MIVFYHQRLQVYQETLDFIEAVEKLVVRWPAYRRYLVNQLRRAASSIALNIAEGAHEFSEGEKKKFYRYARRSAGECVCVIDLALRLRLTTTEQAEPYYKQLNRIIAMLTTMAQPR